MKRSTVAAAMLLALLPSALAAQASLLGQVAWLEGCWEMARSGSRTVERWWPVDQGVMTGESRTITAAGVERESERLRLFVRGDTLVYEATPSRQQRTEFKSVSPAGEEIVFANPEHDFPQRIVYRRMGRDSLVARIEGDRDGRRAPVSFPYRRIPCPG